MKTAKELQKDIESQKSVYEYIKLSCEKIIERMYNQNKRKITIEYKIAPNSYHVAYGLLGDQSYNYQFSVIKEFDEMFQQDKDCALSTMKKVFNDYGYDFNYTIESSEIVTGSLWWKKTHKCEKYNLNVTIQNEGYRTNG